MELPSALYRKRCDETKQSKKQRPVKIKPLEPTSAILNERSRSRSRSRFPKPKHSMLSESTVVDEFGRLSSLKHFALYNNMPSFATPTIVATPWDVLLNLVANESKDISQQAIVPALASTPEPMLVPIPEPAIASMLVPIGEPILVTEIRKPAYVPKQLEKMFGTSVSLAIRKVMDWYLQGKWKNYPCVLWGPSGVGKTLLCTLFAAKFQASFVTYENEFDVMDKLNGWMQSSSRKETGVLAFSTSSLPSHNTWLLLDDVDSLEGMCRKDVLALFKKGKTYPGPIFLTCNDVYEKSMSALKALPLTLQLQPHTVENLSKLVRTINPSLLSEQVTQIATVSCGDARRTVIATQQQQTAAHEADPTLYHSPFAAAEALFKKPEIHSRALDGQEYLVQSLLYQNYPHMVQDVQQLSRVADEWCQFDCLDSLHELPEYTKTYLTFVVPHVCRRLSFRRGSSSSRLNLNPKFMNQSFPHKKVSLDWHCFPASKMLIK